MNWSKSKYNDYFTESINIYIKMNKPNIINYIITECSLDDRINDGMFNPFLQEHMEIMIEKLMEINIPTEEIKEFANKIVEGKYPERQAYNKEGFLVTFPTPDYKTQALSTGNYFNYDPTHGKGGMHLVRKADPSTITPDDSSIADPAPVVKSQPNQQQSKPVSGPTQLKPQQDKAPTQPTQLASVPQQPSPIKTSTTPEKPLDIPSPVDSLTSPLSEPTDIGTKNVSNPSTPAPIQTLSKKEKTPVEYGTGEPEGEPLDLTDFSAYKDPSLEWAHNQKWEKRDNGNYYDNKGTLRAVIGLDGSAVPATENGRISLRKWIDKKRQERLPGEKT